MFLVTADEMQRMDRTTIESLGFPGRLLMENAGRGATAFFLESLYRNHPQTVGVVAGKGNNGGDGFVMARYLSQKGIPATVFVLAPKDGIKGDAAVNLELLERLKIPVVEVVNEKAFEAAKPQMARQQFWIDAMLGTGLTADVRDFYKAVIEFINAQQRPVLAVDIPSGINADTGQVCGTCIRATATATFGFAKVGHISQPGRTHCGKLQIVEIGIPVEIARKVGCDQRLITPARIARDLPTREAAAHKGDTGHLLVLAGSPGKTGAAAMAATAAIRSGAGLVTLGTPRSLHGVLETLVTEAMSVGLPETKAGQLAASAWGQIEPLLADKRCLAAGPGIGTADSTGKLLFTLMENCPIPQVLDADALSLIAADPDVLTRCQGPVVLTPHPGEMARLSGRSSAEIQSDRVGHARAFATRYGVHLVLKGAGTVVAHPNGTVFINPTGNPGMAAGGMGDVLTGLLAGLITQQMDVAAAARAAVYLHGLAADRLAQVKGPVGFLATEVMAALPEAMDGLDPDSEPPAWLHQDRLCYPSPPLAP